MIRDYLIGFSAIGAVLAGLSVGLATSAKAQTSEWRDLGSVNGCTLHQRGVCYVLICDNGQSDLSCR
jgi:hypothetical protein